MNNIELDSTAEAESKGYLANELETCPYKSVPLWNAWQRGRNRAIDEETNRDDAENEIRSEGYSAGWDN